MKITKENAVVGEFDKKYNELVEKIINEGEVFSNRTGVDTLSVEGVNFKFEDIEHNFPILESKKVFIKNALSEILWIHQAQSNNVSWLKERGNNIWSEWEIDEDGIYRIYEPVTVIKTDSTYKIVNDDNTTEEGPIEVVDVNGNLVLDKYNRPLTTHGLIEGKKLKKAIYFGKEWAGTIGTAYGWINNKIKRPQYVLQSLNENPNDRRMNIILWQDEYIKTATLPPCVWGTEWKVSNGKLHCYAHQRSADVGLGLPFNVSQYAILHRLFAKVSNLEAGSLNYSIMDAHIYVTHLQQMKQQLKRYKKMEYYSDFISRASLNTIMEMLTSLEYEEEKLRKYVAENQNNESAQKHYYEVLDNLNVVKLLLNRKKPTLEIKDNDNFFDINNKVNNDKEYLKENPTGNEDIKLLNYSSLSYLKMPIVQ